MAAGMQVSAWYSASVERLSCQGCFDQSASTSYEEQDAWAYNGTFRRTRSAKVVRPFETGPNAAAEETASILNRLSTEPRVWHPRAREHWRSPTGVGETDCLRLDSASFLRQPHGIHSCKVTSSSSRLVASVRCALFCQQLTICRFSSGQPLGWSWSRHRRKGKHVSRATKEEVEAPLQDLASVDLDSLDLSSPEAAEILRAAKEAQLAQLSPEELKALPRRKRLVPKRAKRARQKGNAFFRLGDRKKLEKIRDTLKAGVKGDESDDEDWLLNEDGEGSDTVEEDSLEAMLKTETDEASFRVPRRRRFSGLSGLRKRVKDTKEASARSNWSGVVKNEMKDPEKREGTRKADLAAHIEAHRGSSAALIRKVMQMWEAGELKAEGRFSRAVEEVEELQYGLSYDTSRLHGPFHYGPQDAFQEMLALQPEERSRFFHEGLVDSLKHDSAGTQFEAFKDAFYKTLITRAQAVNKYCETLADAEQVGYDCSALDMAVYLTRFLTRNYKHPEDISAIVASVEDRVENLQERLSISRELAVGVLISYPRYFSPSFDLEKKVDGVLSVLERLEYDSASLARLISKNPSIFNHRLQRIADNIKVLQALGLAEAKFATRVPWLLGTNLMYRLAERVVLLRKFGFSDSEIPVCFQRNILFFMTTVETITKHMSYLQKASRSPEWFHDAVLAHPQIVSCHAERQVKRIGDALMKVGLETTNEQLLELLVRSSPLYQMSSKKLELGLAYITKDLGLSPEVFLEFPQAVGYSLEGRIKPRVKICQSMGLVLADKGQPGLSLAQILVTTFPLFKYCIESGIWLRKYGGHAKQVEYDETGKVLAGLAEEEAEYQEDAGEVEIDLPEIRGQV